MPHHHPHNLLFSMGTTLLTWHGTTLMLQPFHDFSHCITKDATLNSDLSPTHAMSCCAAVFEPRYLELFRSLQASTPSEAEPQFGHILAASKAPPALMQHSVGGLPPLGVCATVKSIEDLGNGRLQVGTPQRHAQHHCQCHHEVLVTVLPHYHQQGRCIYPCYLLL